MSFKHTAAAIEAEGLTHTEKLVLIILSEYADNETGQCYPSRETVARKAMVAPDTVTRICASLRDKGLISLQARYRDNGSRTSNSIIVFPPKRVVDAPIPPDAGSGTPPTQDRGAPDAGSGAPRLHVLDQNLSDINLSDEPTLHSAQARGVEEDLEAQVREALGDVADWTSPALLVMYPLTLLLTDRPDNPACTVREIVDAARKLAVWFQKRGLKMRNWDRVVDEARSLRNLRLTSSPVPPPQGNGDNPASWDVDRWRKALEIALRLGKWPDKWGPPPGADGTMVPQELWKLWKQDA